jgi:DNA-binding XRE family transcriptional regulator
VSLQCLDETLFSELFSRMVEPSSNPVCIEHERVSRKKVCKRTEGWNAAFKRLREQAGLSQEQLAEAIGCDRSAISHWESGRYYLEKDMLQKALSALNVDARILFRHFGQKATEL